MTSPQLRKMENYTILKYIGKGSFGIVSKIETKDDKKVYALKQIDLPGKSGSKENKESYEEAQREYAILKKGLKNVVRSYGSFYDPKANSFFFSMDFCKYNLKTYIETYFDEKKSNIPFEKFLSIFRDIINGKKSRIII